MGNRSMKSINVSYHDQSAEKNIHRDEGFNEVAAEADREKVGSKGGKRARKSGHDNVVNVGSNGGVKILYKNEMTMSKEEMDELEAKLIENVTNSLLADRWGQTNEVPEDFSQRGGSDRMDEGSSEGKVGVENNLMW